MGKRQRKARKAAEEQNGNRRHYRLVFSGNEEQGVIFEPYVPAGLQKKMSPDEIEEKLWEDEQFVEKYNKPQPKAAAQKATSSSQSPAEEALDGDCYFPNDGYDYDQHLRSTAKNFGGVAISAEDNGEAAKKAEETYFAGKHTNDTGLTREEEEAIAALSDAESVGDADSVADANLEDLFGEKLEPAPREVLWGRQEMISRFAKPGEQSQGSLEDRAFQAYMAGDLGGEYEVEEEEEDWDWEEGEEEWEEGEEEDAAAKVDNAGFEGELNEELKGYEIGDLEEQEIQGTIDINDCDDLLDEFLEDAKWTKKVAVSEEKPKAEDIVGNARAFFEREDGEESEDENPYAEQSDDEQEKWDVETIQTTKTNTTNRPGRIDIERKKQKREKKPAMEPIAEDEMVDLPALPETALGLNGKGRRGETKEEKAARKAAVKEYRKAARELKQKSKQAFKAEGKKLAAEQSRSGDVRQGCSVIKLD